MPPPSFTSRDDTTGTPTSPAMNCASPRSCVADVQSPPPQPLKIQSTAASDPSAACTKVGPESRSQKSSIVRSTVSIPAESIRFARARSVGSTIMVTG